MLAAVLRTPGPVDSSPLAITHIPIPLPGPGQILVRVQACGVCRTDLHVVEGELPVHRSPLVPGHQAVGTIDAFGPGPPHPTLRLGDRVGVAWLRSTCGSCTFCSTQRENLCDNAQFNGWTADGGFAQFMVAPADFVHILPPGIDPLQAAPLLCAGIIGYRALKLSDLNSPATTPRPRHIGIYGFGAAGHVVIQLARSQGACVYVCTRDRERHQSLAAQLGATWVGDQAQPPPQRLDAAIVFAPAGELVPPALAALDKGGVLVLAGIHMSDIPSLPYHLLYSERVIRSVANNTRADARELLALAASVPVRTHIHVFPLAQANQALQALKHDAIKGAAVLRIPPHTTT